MTKRITIGLNAKSIDKAIKSIKKVHEDTDKKVLRLIDAMLKDGEAFAKVAVGHVDTGATRASIMGYREGNRGVIVAGGAAVWIEFGTGVTRNSAVHPKAAEHGEIKPWGTYVDPVKNKSRLPHGGNPNGWWYYDESGQKHHTMGIQANMFMYQTAKYLQEIFVDKSKEVFR